MPTQYSLRKRSRTDSNKEHRRQKAYVTLDRKWTSKMPQKLRYDFPSSLDFAKVIFQETKFVRSTEKYFKLPLKIECSLRRYPFDSSIAFTFEINRKKSDKKTFVNSIAKFFSTTLLCRLASMGHERLHQGRVKVNYFLPKTF